jgi:hypothetical protein
MTSAFLEFSKSLGNDLPTCALIETASPSAGRQRAFNPSLTEAAQGEKDLLEICVSLRLVLALEGVECLMK